MATVEPVTTAQEQPLEKGLKSGALGLISSTVIATASVAPAYSIAATLVFVVLAVGIQAPAVAVLAFVPMLLTSIGYSELNKADPDCGTTFTWATRAFGPRTGWAGGWGIVAADVLVMASLAQVASQYVLPAVRRHGHRQRPDQRLGAARRHHLDHPDDRHLLRRHRGVGQLPEDTAGHRAHHAVRPVDSRPGQGRQRTARRPGT